MERVFMLSSLAASGTDTAPRRITELAAELGASSADLRGAWQPVSQGFVEECPDFP
ncbi:hypothetical protein ABZY81_13535 [Streptomyces sp. NPDC006514]|uniref:hypothetical protein n=1 Tax=Streptomyces sp. NPDC006514 TaxID=3154308 RepID=UPI0033A585DD